MKRLDKFMDLAAKVANLSSEREYRFGAVITKGTKVVSVACNSPKTHTKIKWKNRGSKYPDGRLHAEARAILLAKTDLRRCDIYVFRQRNCGDAGDSFPCQECLKIIVGAQIKNIFYMNDGIRKQHSV